ncbi:GNAT family N-acetyltransferase [Streptomyces uncialis]|uniref:GNAT family N-acetyltransferase n=1 Tax=Streptomyces uncialis TaxID=1048205 RepID=UPI00381725AE
MDEQAVPGPVGPGTSGSPDAERRNPMPGLRFGVRPATSGDASAVETLVLARSDWLEKRGLPSWRADAGLVSALTANPDGSMWILEADGRPVGCTTVTDSTPPMAWTEQELSEPSLYLYTTVTDPAVRAWKPGTLLALWALDRAFQEGKVWLRRGCRFPGLVTYYQRQGFAVVHEMQKSRGPMYLMARRAGRVKDLQDRFNGTPPPYA